MKILLSLLLVLAVTGLALAGGLFFTQPLPDGQLLDAFALDNGDAVTVSLIEQGEQEYLLLAYYDTTHGTPMTQQVALTGPPETLIIHLCGGYLQGFIGYAASVPDDLSTARAERFVWQLPRVQECMERVFLPLIEK